jgi:hypothetical protein
MDQCVLEPHEGRDRSPCKYTPEQVEEKTVNSQRYNPTDKSTSLLYFLIWLGFPIGVQVLFILGTSLLVRPRVPST